MPPKMYVYQTPTHPAWFELRQARYRPQLQKGREHPHDVCAVASSVDELRRMTEKHWPDVWVRWDAEHE